MCRLRATAVMPWNGDSVLAWAATCSDRDSGRRKNTSPPTSTPNTASARKMACQSATASTQPPAIGARIGARPITSISSENIRGASRRS